MSQNIFIDSSAFIALYLMDDNFHLQAQAVLKNLKEEQAGLITSNFILDETYTFLRAKINKHAAIDFANFLMENTDLIKIIRITVADEKRAFIYFQNLDGRGVSFTDCTSLALMERTKIKTAFTFDHDFKRAKFKIVP